MIANQKFIRRYSLLIETADGNHVTIPGDVTLQFEILRNSLASSNTAKFTLLNLGPETRNLIYKDRYQTTVFRAVQLRAGYKDFMPLVFNGGILQAYSESAGSSSDVVTTIECYDGGIAFNAGFTSMTIGAGQSATQVIKTLASTLPYLTAAPIVGNFPATNKRAEVIWGNTWRKIQEKSGGFANVDNGQVKVLNLNEVIEGPIPLINADTGLLGAPKRSDALIEIELLFEPRITVGQALALQSEINPLFNGVYKVQGFSHRGVISPRTDEATTTTAQLWLGTAPFTMIKGILAQ